MAANGALTSQQLAERAGMMGRYIREWLSSQAASGYIEYDAVSRDDDLAAMTANAQEIREKELYTLRLRYSG